MIGTLETLDIDVRGDITAPDANRRVRFFGVAEVSTSDPVLIAEGMIYHDPDDNTVPGRVNKTVALDTVLTANDDIIYVNAAAGEVRLTLPVIGSLPGQTYTAKKIDSSTNKVILDGNGTDTIDGLLTQELTVQYAAITISDRPAEWGIL